VSFSAYTGYIDVEARHIFFYFFQSRGNWTEDDVVFWTNGGPGCSSAGGLFMELGAILDSRRRLCQSHLLLLGPCRISDDFGPSSWEYGWNEHANVFFVDQPVGVGFSYADHGEHVVRTIPSPLFIPASSVLLNAAAGCTRPHDPLHSLLLDTKPLTPF
jgi:carboxypeptidase C (cathepsin A)